MRTEYVPRKLSRVNARLGWPSSLNVTRSMFVPRTRAWNGRDGQSLGPVSCARPEAVFALAAGPAKATRTPKASVNERLARHFCFARRVTAPPF